MTNDENQMVKLLNENFTNLNPNLWYCKTNSSLLVNMRKHEDGEVEFDWLKKQPSNYHPEFIYICGLYTPDDIKAIITLIR